MPKLLDKVYIKKRNGELLSNNVYYYLGPALSSPWRAKLQLIGGTSTTVYYDEVDRLITVEEYENSQAAAEPPASTARDQINSILNELLTDTVHSTTSYGFTWLSTEGNPAAEEFNNQERERHARETEQRRAAMVSNSN